MQETRVRSLGWEDPLEKGTATHCSILSWRIPWTEEPRGLQSMGLQRVGHDWAANATTTATEYSWHPQHCASCARAVRRRSGRPDRGTHRACVPRTRSLQSCPTLCDPMDYSLPDSSVHGGSWRGPFVWRGVAEMGCRDVAMSVRRAGIGRAGWTGNGLEGGWQHQNLLCFCDFDVSFTKLIRMVQKTKNKGD